MEDETNIIYGFQRIETLNRLASSKYGPQIFGLGSVATEIGAGISISNGRVLLGLTLFSVGCVELGLSGASSEIKIYDKFGKEEPGQQG